MAERSVFAVLDFETGGFDPDKSALCSVGLVRLDSQLQEVDWFYTVIKDEPGKEIRLDALAINGLTLEQLEAGAPVQEVLAAIAERIGGHILVAHNAAFDVGFLNARGFAVKEAIDTMDLAWKVWPYQKAKLGLVCDRLGITVKDAHNSLGDVRLTAKLLAEFSAKYNLPLVPAPIRFDRWKVRT